MKSRDKMGSGIRLTLFVCALGLSAGVSAEALEGTVDLGGVDRVIAGGLVGTGEITNSSATPATLTIVCEGDATFEGTVSGNILLVKTGAGTQRLIGANVHTGGTRVEGGFLAVDSAAALGADGASLVLCGGGLLAREDLTVDTDRHAVTCGPGLAVWRTMPGKSLSLSGGNFRLKASTELVYEGGGQVNLGVWMAYDLGNLASSTLTVGEGTTLRCLNALVLGGVIPKWSFARTRLQEGCCVFAYGLSHLSNLEMTGAELRLWHNDGAAGVGFANAEKYAHATALGDIKVLASQSPSRIVGKTFQICEEYDGTVYGASVFDIAEGAVLEMDAVLSEGPVYVGGMVDAARSPAARGVTKAGVGELKLLASCALGGDLCVRDGTLTLAWDVSLSPSSRLVCVDGARIQLTDGACLDAAVIADSALLRSADVWLDAATLDAVDGAQVETIANRGTSGGAFHVKTIGATRDRAPVLAEDGINGLPALRFDGTQSLHLDYENKTEHFTLFAVYKWDAWSNEDGKGLWSGPFAFGPILPSWAEDNSLPGAVAYYTKDGPQRIFGYANYADAAGKVVQTYRAADARANVDDGLAALLQEHEINGAASSLALGWDATDAEVRDTSMGGDRAEEADLRRNIEMMVVGARMLNDGCAYSKHMLDGRIGEILVFSRALTDAEKRAVRAYLKAKWFADGKTAPVVKKGSDAVALEVAVPTGSTAVLGGAFSGTAALRKVGGGSLVLATQLDAVLAADEGTLTLAATQTMTQADVWVDPSDSQTVSLDATGAHVEELKNKGRVGGFFSRAKSPSTWKYDVAYPTLSANGINGRTSLSFDGLSALCLENAFRNQGQGTRNLHVYAVLKRTAYEDKMGKGLYGGAWSLYRGGGGANDDAQAGSFFMTEKSDGDGKGGVSMVQNGAASGVIKPVADGTLTGKAVLLVAHGAPTSVWGTRLDASSDPEALTFAGTFNSPDLAAFDIDLVALGARGGSWDTVQVYGEGDDRNRSWRGEMGEFIVFTNPLTPAEERSLVDYLRRKWLGVGAGTAEPPAFLAGRLQVPELGRRTALSVGASATLASETVSATIASLTLADGARIVRTVSNPDGVDAFRLFDVLGALVCRGDVRLHVKPRPVASAVFLGYGDSQGTGVWRCEGKGRYSVVDFPAVRELRFVRPGGLLLIR